MTCVVVVRTIAGRLAGAFPIAIIALLPEEGTAPVLVPVTLVSFRLFSHTLKIKPTLGNTLVDIMLDAVLATIVFGGRPIILKQERPIEIN